MDKKTKPAPDAAATLRCARASLLLASLRQSRARVPGLCFFYTNMQEWRWLTPVLCFFCADPLDDDKDDLAMQVVRAVCEHIEREPAAPEVEEEAAQLEEARAAGLVHVRGKTRFHVGRDTCIFDRVLLGFYEFLHTTCRSALLALGIPLQERVEIGMLYMA